LHLILEDINPYSLMQDFTDIYVVSSQIGMEALLLGKRVHCFGMPFYAGWGLTIDDLQCDRRSQASLEEVFAAAYMRYTHYVSPQTGQECELKHIIEYIVDARPKRGQVRHANHSPDYRRVDLSGVSSQTHELCVVLPYREQESKHDSID